MSTIALGLIVALPFRLAAAVALAVLAGLLLTDKRSLRVGRQIGLVLLALAFENVWTSPVLVWLHVLVGSLDARATTALLGLLNIKAIYSFNIIHNVDANFVIEVWPLCASSMPLAGVGVAFLTMFFYFDKIFRVRYLFWLAMSLLASILLTEIRLALLATSEASFQWWHDGPGSSLHTLAALGLAVLFPVLAASTSDAARDQAPDRHAG